MPEMLHTTGLLHVGSPKVQFGHPEANRAMAIRERSTLQAIPKHYHLHVQSFYKLSRQICNAELSERLQKTGERIMEII